MTEESPKVLRKALEDACEHLKQLHKLVYGTEATYYADVYVSEAKEALEPKLLPCPFCGIIPRVFLDCYDKWDIHHACSCSGGTQTGYLVAQAHNFSTKEEAIAVWNTRK
jgi:hypothetical protein